MVATAVLPHQPFSSPSLSIFLPSPPWHPNVGQAVHLEGCGHKDAVQLPGLSTPHPSLHPTRPWTKLTQPLPPTVAALPGGASCRWPGPEPPRPCCVPGVCVLLPAGPHSADQAAQLMLRHLDSGGGRAPLLVSVLCAGHTNGFNSAPKGPGGEGALNRHRQGKASPWPGHPSCPSGSSSVTGHIH